jgi:mercuric ion transport protein
MNKTRAYFSGALSLLICPCHLPLTFPLLLSLTAGTALGAWLAGRFWLLFGISTALFLVSLGLALWWMTNSQEGAACAVEPPK